MEDIQKKEGLDNPEENPENPEEPEVEEDDLKEFGEDEDLDLLETEELAQQNREIKKKLATAIKQKRKWREQAKNPPKEEEEKPQKKEEPEETDIDQRIEAKLREKEIEGLDTSDVVKEEIKKQLKAGTYKSVKEAKSSDFIQFLIQKEQAKQKEDKASISPTRKGGEAKIDFSEISVGDFDLSTKEGRKDFGKWKDWLKTQQ